MKAQFNTFLDVALGEEVRELAKAANVPVGEAVGLFLRLGLARIDAPRLASWWVEHKESQPGGPRVRAADAAMLAALQEIAKEKAAAGLPRVCGAKDIADRAGVHWAEGFLALQRLRARGLAVGGNMEDLDRWGRPKASIWYLTERGSA